MIKICKGAFYSLGFLLIMLGVSPLAVGETPTADTLNPIETLERERQQLLRELEAREEQRRSRHPVIEETLGDDEEFKLPDDEDTEFELKGLHFSESVLLDDEELRYVAERFVGKVVNFSDLNYILDRINQKYRDKGHVNARALIPPQVIEEGLVAVLLVEGRLGQVRLSGNRYTSEEFIRDSLQLPDEGEYLDLMDLQRALDLFNDQFSANLLGSLEPGRQFGESDLELLVQEPDRWSLSLFSDNTGSKNTGRERGGVLGSYRSLWHDDDRFFVYAAGTESSTSAMLSYNRPVPGLWGNRQARLDTRLSGNLMEVTDGPFKELGIDGHSASLETAYRQPWGRGQNWVTDLNARVSYSLSQSEYSNFELSDYDVIRGALGVRYGFFPSPHQVYIDKNLVVASNNDKIARDREDFFYWTGSLNLFHRTQVGLSSQLRLAWQLAHDRDVPSSDLFQVGGMHSVRGYEENVLSGARGFSLSWQVNWEVHPWFIPYVFYETGLIQSVSPHSEGVRSAGGGFNWQITSYLNGQLDAGYAFDEVTPDQEDYQIHFRINVNFSG